MRCLVETNKINNGKRDKKKVCIEKKIKKLKNCIKVHYQENLEKWNFNCI